jgi:hypothetical protein
LESTDEFVNYRPDLSRGNPRIIGRGQFFVIILFHGDPPMNGAVFEMTDGCGCSCAPRKLCPKPASSPRREVQRRELFGHISILNRKESDEGIIMAAQTQSLHGGAKSGCQKANPSFRPRCA